MKKIYLLTSLLIILFSCKKTEQLNNETVKIDLSSILENPKKDKIFSNTRYVKLESNPDILLGEHLTFETTEDKIYILDLGDLKSVLEFDVSGKFIGKVGKRGNGPDEYVSAKDFLVRNDTIDILVSMFTYSVIYSYLNTGEFIEKKEFPFNAYSFQRVHNMHYAFSLNYDKTKLDHMVYLFGDEGIEVNKFLPNNTKIDIPADVNCFSTCNGDVYYFEPFNNKIFTFSNDSLVLAYDLNFGNFNIPGEFFQQSLLTGFELINKKGFSIIRNVFSNKEYLFLEITKQKDISVEVFHIVYNKKTREIKYITITENDHIFRYPISINNKNEMMYLVFPIGDLNEKAKQFGIDLDIKNVNESDNPIIMFCQLK